MHGIKASLKALTDLAEDAENKEGRRVVDDSGRLSRV
jgi:hypothetical protein